jgi:aminoglycoside phosphotransferase (APT) family kinase protein
MRSAVGTPLVVGHVDWRCEHVLVDPGNTAVRAVHDWDSLTAGPEEWIVGSASVCFTVDFNAGDGSPARWPSPSESAAFVAAYGSAGLDAAQVRAAGDYHLAYIARCVHSVGGFPEVADLLHERATGGT